MTRRSFIRQALASMAFVAAVQLEAFVPVRRTRNLFYSIESLSLEERILVEIELLHRESLRQWNVKHPALELMKGREVEGGRGLVVNLRTGKLMEES